MFTLANSSSNLKPPTPSNFSKLIYPFHRTHSPLTISGESKNTWSSRKMISEYDIYYSRDILTIYMRNIKLHVVLLIYTFCNNSLLTLFLLKPPQQELFLLVSFLSHIVLPLLIQHSVTSIYLSCIHRALHNHLLWC